MIHKAHNDCDIWGAQWRSGAAMSAQILQWTQTIPRHSYAINSSNHERKVGLTSKLKSISIAQHDNCWMFHIDSGRSCVFVLLLYLALYYITTNINIHSSASVTCSVCCSARTISSRVLSSMSGSILLFWLNLTVKMETRRWTRANGETTHAYKTWSRADITAE